ncbi:hypothetical protein PAXINDRAFT_17103 [Paxillus involutus ATCC 200175]|uniref:Uncharacterized protein n=1 Tax=Paxillus involutus ATCC 200175 TaxID=664439 RepID=A0A0C9SQS2_PAXIN|nr:hypothetical protein PAXINDRAFT_17103 [Paxillus involutus ATCC 200175]
MIDTGSPTSGTSHDSLRVETGALADNEASQQCNGKPNVSMNSPGPSTPLPYASRRPTHQVNPPRRRGRLKSPPTNVSQPERTEYAPRRTVESTTTQANRTQRKRHRATGGVSQSHHSQGRRHRGPYVDTAHRRHHHPYPRITISGNHASVELQHHSPTDTAHTAASSDTPRVITDSRHLIHLSMEYPFY